MTSRIAEAVSKHHWVAQRLEELPFIMHRAYSSMAAGRPGPAHVEIPMDTRAEAAEVTLHSLEERVPVGVPGSRCSGKSSRRPTRCEASGHRVRRWRVYRRSVCRSPGASREVADSGRHDLKRQERLLGRP